MHENCYNGEMDDLNSPDAQKVFQSLNRIFETSWAKHAHQNHQDLFERANALNAEAENLEQARDILKSQKWTLDDMATATHPRHIQHLLEQAAIAIAALNERGDLRTRLKEALHPLKEAGIKAEACLPYMHVALTATAHPTFDLSFTDDDQDGERLYRALVGLADLPPKKRQKQAKVIIKYMITTRLTPARKMNMFDETHFAAFQEEIYLSGLLEFLTNLQHALNDIYEQDAPNLAARHIELPQLMMHSWYSFDADGKDNADDRALLAKIIQSTLTFTHFINALDKKKHFKTTIKALEKLYQKLPILLGDQNTPNLFEELHRDFEVLFAQLEWTIEAKNTKADDPTWQINALLNQTHGFQAALHESRHASEDLEAVFKGFFAYLKSNGHEFPDTYTPKEQLKYLHKNHSPAQIREWLEAANPSHLVLRRFALMSEHPHTVPQGVIANVQKYSLIQQQFIAEAYGLDHMIHIPLFEDEEGSANMIEICKFYAHSSFGQHNKAARNDAQDMIIMMAGSDYQKSNGSDVKYRQKRARAEIFAWCAEEGLNIPVYSGSGLSIGRAGQALPGIPALGLYIFAQNQDIKSLSTEDRARLKHMLFHVQTTTQGRDLSRRLGTAGQIVHLLADILERSAEITLVLAGKKPLTDIIPAPVKYTPEMMAARGAASLEARQKSEALRTHDQGKPLNQWGRRHGCIEILHYASTGARKVGRKLSFNESGDAKPLTKLRAIGHDKAIDASATYWHGYYGGAMRLLALHAAYRAGKITSEDLSQYASDPYEWTVIYKGEFMALARTDFSHLLDESWSIQGLLNSPRADYNLRFAHAMICLTALTEGLLAGTWDQDLEEIIYDLYAPQDPIIAKFGPKTRARLKTHGLDLEELKQTQKNTLFERAVIHEIDEDLRKGRIKKETCNCATELHQTAIAFVATTLVHFKSLLK